MRGLAFPYMTPTPVPPNTSSNREPRSVDWPHHPATRAISSRFQPQGDLKKIYHLKTKLAARVNGPRADVIRSSVELQGRLLLNVTGPKVRKLKAESQRLSRQLRIIVWRRRPDPNQ